MQHLPQLVELPPIQGVEASDVVAAVLRVTGGNLRLVVRLLTQIARVLEINETQTVSLDIVEAAREVLAIGSAWRLVPNNVRKTVPLTMQRSHLPLKVTD